MSWKVFCDYRNLAFLFSIISLGILDKKSNKGQLSYLVKWENYVTPTWEPSGNLPAFLTHYYKKTSKSSIPSARVKHTKTVGGSKLHLLVWDSPEGEKSAFNFENSEENEAYSCNTRKVRIF